MTETDLDALLDGDDSATSPSQDPEQNDGAQPKSPDEVQEFSKLSGSTQDRVRKLISRAKNAEAEAERMKALAYSNTKLPPPPPASPDISQAVNQLDQVGIATKDFVKQELQRMLQQNAYDQKISKLSSMENGENGRPKFDQMEYEDYVRQNPKYQYYEPEDVFSIMYKNELTDWESKHREDEPRLSQPLKNNKTNGRDDVWSPEYIEEMIKEKGTAWYEKNLDKINKVMEASTR